MKRRSFLKGMFGVPAGIVAGSALAKVEKIGDSIVTEQSKPKPKMDAVVRTESGIFKNGNYDNSPLVGYYDGVKIHCHNGSIIEGIAKERLNAGDCVTIDNYGYFMRYNK